MELTQSGTVFIRHGHIGIKRIKGGYRLDVRIHTHTPHYQSETIFADSISQRDEYIDRIRKYAEILE